MDFLRKVLLSLTLCAAGLSAHASTQSTAMLPEQLSGRSSALAPALDTMTFIGEGKLRVAIWDIYQAQLYATDSEYKSGQPFALKLTYLRAFSKDQLLKETAKQLKKLNHDHNYESWIAALDNTWVDVKKNDSLTLLVNNMGHAIFYLNGMQLGTIADRAFSRCFTDIWLSKKTSTPYLRQKLLGESS